jgi:L-alanine-DL-glutamate epimerase-like enolase superfamily enzyme
MRIERFRTYYVSLPLRKPVSSSIHNITSLENVLLEIDAGGFTGIGYAFAFTSGQAKAIHAMVEDLAETLVGQDALAIRSHWQKLWNRINMIGQAGPPVMALSAIDTALWDILAQRANLPLYQLLGAYRNEVPVYVSGGWITDPIEVWIQEATSLQERGFSNYKIRIGSPDWQRDVERVRLLREALGDGMNIMVDANQNWSVEVAIRAGRELERYGVNWFEEPVRVQDIQGSAKVAAELNIPLATGETVFTRHGLLPVIQAAAGDVLMLDLARYGGPTEFMQAAALADSYQYQVSSHLYTEISAHLMAACPNGGLVEYMPEWWDDFFEDAPRVERGYIKLSDRPGLGFTFSRQLKQKAGNPAK